MVRPHGSIQRDRRSSRPARVVTRPTSDQSSLPAELRAVDAMIGQGAPFNRIEAYIEALPLPHVQLSALWLLAWAEATDPATRRRIVTETLAYSGSQA